jgi:hypothetical protein
MVDGRTYLAKVTVDSGLFTGYQRLYITPHYGSQAHPCIAKDGSYIIFDVASGAYMYVSFKKPDGSWGEGIDLTAHGFDPKAGGATLSPDGKYLFFCLNGDIWWVDARVIEKLRDDTDGDAVLDIYDNCPDVVNPIQEDFDNDGSGDYCDACTDADYDGYGDPGFPHNSCLDDNCPDVPNPDQSDFDQDGIGDACCCRIRADVDHGGTRDISDITYFVDFMFGGGPLAPCPEEGDIDGSGTTDVSDLTYYIAFMFEAGAMPPPCP